MHSLSAKLTVHDVCMIRKTLFQRNNSTKAGRIKHHRMRSLDLITYQFMCYTWSPLYKVSILLWLKIGDVLFCYMTFLNNLVFLSERKYFSIKTWFHFFMLSFFQLYFFSFPFVSFLLSSIFLPLYFFIFSFLFVLIFTFSGYFFWIFWFFQFFSFSFH